MQEQAFFELKNNFGKYKNVKSRLIIGERQRIDPEFSILIPTYNRLELLEEAIDSAINQSISNSKFEIIIVDNNPEPNIEIENMIRAKKCKNLSYFKNETNIGMVGNWNRCIELASGKWITFLHDDDLFIKNFLIDLVEAIKVLPGYSLYAPTPITKRGIQPINIAQVNKKKYYALKPYYFIFSNLIPTQGTTFLRENCISLGGYSEELFPGGPDNIFHVQYLLQYKGVRLLNTNFIYRIEDNETFKNDVLVKSIINAYLIKIDLNRKIKKWSFITLPFIKNDFVFNLIDKNSVSETKINIQFELNQLSVSPLWGNRYFSIIRRIMLKIFLVYLQMTEKYLIPTGANSALNN